MRTIYVVDVCDAMSNQFSKDFLDLVAHISQHLSSDDTRLLAFREGLPTRLQEEKPLIVLQQMINQQIIAENKLKDFEAALKVAGRKDLAECVRKFSKKKKGGLSTEGTPISEFEKLNLAMCATKSQAHLSHVHVQQLLQSLEHYLPHQLQAVAELREAKEKCAEVCKIIKSVAKACELGHPEECVGSDDDCSSLSSTLSNRGEWLAPWYALQRRSWG